MTKLQIILRNLCPKHSRDALKKLVPGQEQEGT